MTQLMGYLFRNNLVEISPDMTAVPELAESWESRLDAKQWIFRLLPQQGSTPARI